MFKNKWPKTALAAAVLTAATVAATGPGVASAVSAPLSCARIAAHFDLARHQMPENIALAPDGSAYVTFAAARQVARIDPGEPPGSWPPCPHPPTAAPIPRSWASP